MLVYGKCECFIMQRLYACVLCASCGNSQYMEEAYSRAGLITALYAAMSVSFCLPHPVAVSAFMICRGLCACTEILWMRALYVSFGSKVRPRTFGCVAIGSALLLFFRSRLLIYSAGSGVNRVQVVLSGFSMRYEIVLFCPGKNFILIWLYVFLGCTRACVSGCDADVVCVCHD